MKLKKIKFNFDDVKPDATSPQKTIRTRDNNEVIIYDKLDGPGIIIGRLISGQRPLSWTWEGKLDDYRIWDDNSLDLVMYNKPPPPKKYGAVIINPSALTVVKS